MRIIEWVLFKLRQKLLFKKKTGKAVNKYYNVMRFLNEKLLYTENIRVAKEVFTFKYLNRTDHYR